MARYGGSILSLITSKGVVVRRYDDYAILCLLCTIFFSFSPIIAEVGPMPSGQSIWWMTKRIGLSADIIESKVDALDLSEGTGIETADFSGTTTLTLSESGNYCLEEDITGDLFITGTGVTLDLNGHCLTGIIKAFSDTPGETIADIVIENGFMTPPAPSAPPSDTIPDAAITFTQAQRGVVRDVFIECADSPGEIAGRTGIEIVGDDVQILGCKIASGAAGEGNPPANGGDGILVTNGSRDTIIRNCIILSTGNGSGAVFISGAEDGGDGGHGVHVNGAIDTVIEECTVRNTGNGGEDVDNGNEGDGGDGIHITVDSQNTLVHDCTLHNMGSTPNTANPGIHGTSIRDLVTDISSLSAIYRNVAHNLNLGSGLGAYYVLRGVTYQVSVATGIGVINIDLVNTTTIRNDFVNIAFAF